MLDPDIPELVSSLATQDIKYRKVFFEDGTKFRRRTME